MDFRKINHLEVRMAFATGRRGHRGRFCPCCCAVGGDPNAEQRLVAKARRRLDKAIIELEVDLTQEK